MPGTTQAFHAPTTATIAAAGTKTGSIGFGSFTRGIFILPAGYEGTGITFEVSVDNDTFVPLNNDSGAVPLVVAASKGYALPTGLAGALYFKIVAGTTQAADRVIQLSLKS